MCGYFAYLRETEALLDIMNQLGIPALTIPGQHYPRRVIKDHVTSNGTENGAVQYHCKEALWWYQLTRKDDKPIADEKITSFNARDLDKPMWRKALKYNRGLVFATEIGESQGKNRYLMRSEEGFALGTLYKDWADGTHSFAIITRTPHRNFEKYHDKSTPLFLPLDAHVLQQWLSPQIEHNETIEELLDYPRIYTDFTVNHVRTYKNAEILGQQELLKKDVL